MNCIKEDPLLELNPDTLVYLRRQYNYEKPGEMDAAIDILDSWIKKQDHFTKKDFSREYLERSIILVKGSVERAKIQIDKICTMRTLMPKYFEFNFDEFEKFKNKFNIAMLPKLTKDNYRIIMSKVMGPSNELNSSIYLLYFKFGVMLWEYLKCHDYCDGVIFIFDYRGLNFMVAVAALNIIDFHQIITLLTQGFQLRVKGVHIVTEANNVDILVSLLKRVFPKKIADRIYVHKTLESIQEVVPKEILTSDLGGHELSLAKLQDKWVEVCKKEENLKHFKEMANAKTNEALRPSGNFNEQHLGIPGSFRSLNVD